MQKLAQAIQSVAAMAGVGTGATTSTEAMKATCPFSECDGSGWVLLSGGKVRRCRCAILREEQERIKRLFSTAKIPRRFQEKRLKDFDVVYQKGAWRIACRYVEQFDTIRYENRNGLCFVGPPGTGKSHLAYAILNSLLERGIPGVCGSVPEIMDMLRPGTGPDQEVRERLELLKNLDVVILDDLGAEKNSDWVTERLYVIINARYNEMLPTIITSNLELEELEQLPGWERIVSRLFEMCYLVRMDGPDYRKGGKK